MDGFDLVTMVCTVFLFALLTWRHQEPCAA